MGKLKSRISFPQSGRGVGTLPLVLTSQDDGRAAAHALPTVWATSAVPLRPLLPPVHRSGVHPSAILSAGAWLAVANGRPYSPAYTSRLVLPLLDGHRPFLHPLQESHSSSRTCKRCTWPSCTCLVDSHSIWIDIAQGLGGGIPPPPAPHLKGSSKRGGRSTGRGFQVPK